MLTEDFLKIVLKFIFCDFEYEDEKDDYSYEDKSKIIVFNNIRSILEYYDEKEKPITLLELFDTTKTLVEKIISNNYTYNKDIIKDSLLNLSETISNYINYISENKITFYEYMQIVYHISYRDKYVKMFKEKDEYINFMKKIEDGNFLDINKTVQQYENLLNKLYFDFSMNKDNLIDNDLLLSNKNFPKEAIIDKNIIDVFTDINKYYLNVTSVSSGFYQFDDGFSFNGFESGRLYLGASQPGFGKSLFLLSSMVKSCKYYDTKEGKNKLIDGKKNLYIYITAENQIYETLIRYASMVVDSTNLNVKDIINKKDNFDFKKELYFENSVIEIKYVSAYNTTTGDIMVLIDKIKAKYNSSEYILRCIYVDYLDLIKPMNKTDMYRLELGFVTMELKNISIRYNAPIVTVTQINNYNVTEKPDLGLLKESKTKGENADCVFILLDNPQYKQYNNDKEKIIDVHIIKNRGYKKGIFSIYVNYDYKKLIGCSSFGEISKNYEYLESYIKFSNKFRTLQVIDNNPNYNNMNERYEKSSEIITFKEYNTNTEKNNIYNDIFITTDEDDNKINFDLGINPKQNNNRINFDLGINLADNNEKDFNFFENSKINDQNPEDF